ncbi:MAG: TetR/AcrR family transcriptional regulator [Acidimicrobiales bacterium]
MVAPRRRDAQRNRDALLQAAGNLFAEEGLQAPLEQVARRAGLAIGTLYRHFPTRADLVEALLEAKLRVWLEAANRATKLPDAWAGFVLYLETMCELQAGDRGFADLAAGQVPVACCLDDVNALIYRLGVRILRRAQRQGCLRPDVTQDDLVLLIQSLSHVTQATGRSAPHTWRRHLHLTLDAYRPESARPLPD